MILAFLQTLRALIRFWHRTADIDGAHAELERHLGADTGGSDSGD